MMLLCLTFSFSYLLSESRHRLSIIVVIAFWFCHFFSHSLFEHLLLLLLFSFRYFCANFLPTTYKNEKKNHRFYFTNMKGLSIINEKCFHIVLAFSFSCLFTFTNINSCINKKAFCMMRIMYVLIGDNIRTHTQATNIFLFAQARSDDDMIFFFIFFGAIFPKFYSYYWVYVCVCSPVSICIVQYMSYSIIDKNLFTYHSIAETKKKKFRKMKRK